jgi:predicted AAA+ superfamily ATPase
MKKRRYLEKPINDLSFAANKMAFVSGPRQAGKTTMAKNMLHERGGDGYYNWDELKFRKNWTKDPSQIIPHVYTSDGTVKPIVVLDEIHKAKLWKRNLKGVYDTLETACDILVTGSARLNVYRKGSDSLLGRYHHFRLHPFSLAELLDDNVSVDDPEKLLEVLTNASNVALKNKDAREKFLALDKFGPFPEPLFAVNIRTLNLWRRGRIEKIIREDLRDITRLPELSRVEMLVALMTERIANPLSIQALSEDLEVAYSTVKRWLLYLQELYYYFEVPPYHKNLKRSLKKVSKLYLWDWSEIEDEAKCFENLIAFHLLKYCDYLTDTGVGSFELNYIRDKEHREIDFILLHNHKPWFMVEVKLNNSELSTNWRHFIPQLPCKVGIQVVKKSGVYESFKTEYGKIVVISADQFLQYLI